MRKYASTLIHNGDLPAGCISATVAQAIGNNQPLCGWIKGSFRYMEPIPNSALEVTNTRPTGQGPRGKPCATFLLKECSKKMTPNDILVYS